MIPGLVIAGLAIVVLGWLVWLFVTAPTGFQHRDYGFLEGKPSDYDFTEDEWRGVE